MSDGREPSSPVVCFISGSAPPPSEAERSSLYPRATEKRRTDFARGRHAAHMAWAQFCRSAQRTSAAVAVVPRSDGAQSGQPQLLDEHGRAVCALSITHAGDVAAAAVCGRPVGLDLVIVERHGAAFEQEAFTAGELEEWRACVEDEGGPLASCVGFAAKEAALKWRGVGLRHSLLALRVTPSEGVSVHRGSAPPATGAPMGLHFAADDVQAVMGWVWHRPEGVVVCVWG